MVKAADVYLDVSEELCPVPALKARRCLDDMQPGQVLTVIATDPLAALDLQILCDRLGHELLASSQLGAVLEVRIRVSPGRQPDAD